MRPFTYTASQALSITALRTTVVQVSLASMVPATVQVPKSIVVTTFEFKIMATSAFGTRTEVLKSRIAASAYMLSTVRTETALAVTEFPSA